MDSAIVDNEMKTWHSHQFQENEKKTNNKGKFISRERIMSTDSKTDIHNNREQIKNNQLIGRLCEWVVEF